jgi:hypothetical protein
MLRRHGSKYASLIFPLHTYFIRKLHYQGYLSDDETTQILLDMGYEFSQAKWIVALDSVTVERWKARLHDGRTA